MLLVAPSEQPGAQTTGVPGKGIAGGYHHSLAVVNNGTGTVWAWGSSDHGKLGDGTSASNLAGPRSYGGGVRRRGKPSRRV